MSAQIGAGYNPFDPEFLANPYPRIQQIHEDAPVCRSELFGSWLITRYDDLAFAADDPIFGSHNKFGPPPAPEILAELEQGYALTTTLFESEYPDRARLRSLIEAAITPELVESFEPSFRATADSLVATFAGAGHADLHERYVEPLAEAGLLDFVGVPREDHARAAAWTGNWAQLFMPARNLEEQIAGAREVVACQRYYQSLIDERAKDPRPDVITALMNARAAGVEPLTPAEIVWELMELIGAGGNTTYGMANVILQVFIDPERRDALLAEPGLVGAAVHEGLRVETPILGGPRASRAAVEVGGVELPEGSPVLLAFAAANLDRKVFPDPDRFDPRRENVDQHVAMGRGRRSCVGARLGHLMIRVAVESLLEHLPRLEFDDGFEPQFEAPYPFLRCVSSLPMHWDAPAAPSGPAGGQTPTI